MKKLYYIIFVISCFIFSCNNNSNNTSNYYPSKEIIAVDENWSLANRIPNCDSAIVYMDNAILPISSRLPSKEEQKRGLNRASIQFYIPGEANNFFKNEKYDYYINAKCLEGLTAETILKIFCTPESYDSFISFNEAYLKEERDWGIEISSRNGFAMGIKLVNGAVQKVNIGGNTKVFHEGMRYIITQDNSWHLKNRIQDCDSAVVFMDHAIVPISAKPGIDLLYPIERMTMIYIPGETNDFWKDERCLFYINPECYVGMPSSEIFKIFCPPNTYNDFITVDKMYQSKNMEWLLYISGRNGFGMGIRIKEGKVVSSVVEGGVSRNVRSVIENEAP